MKTEDILAEELEDDDNSIEGLMRQGFSKIEAIELLDRQSRGVSQFRLMLILNTRLALAWETQRVGSEYNNDNDSSFDHYFTQD